MRALRRANIPPSPLKEKAKGWTVSYLKARKQDAGKRPSSNQYAHEQVRKALRAMSHQKCFYCETRVGPGAYGEEVDHYIEIAEHPKGAFKWKNLYLACRDCNGKVPNKSIAAAGCFDPCATDDTVLFESFRFADEHIQARPEATEHERADNTIRKYHLNGASVSYRRSQAINRYYKLRTQILEAMTRQQRPITQAEREELLAFGNGTEEFSLMFRFLLEKEGFGSPV